MNLKKYLLILLVVMLALAACRGQESQEITPADDAAATDAVQGDTSSSTESEEDTAGDEAISAPDQPATVSGTTGSFFAINEISLGPNGFVALTNFTDVPVSLDGLYLCQGSDCFALPDEVVKGGETVLVAAGDGEELENVVATEATYGELRPADGEIAIFTSEETDDPQALLVYLQWGSTPHELTDLAVEKGLWFETSYAPSGENATRLYRVEESGLWLWE